MTDDPLAGKRVVVTRPPHQAGELADLLRAHGAEPVLMPTIAIVPPADPTPLDDALRRLEDYDWVIFTSANTVEQVWARLAALDVTARWPRVAAIGPTTADALRAREVEPEVVPEQHVAEALFETLKRATHLDGAHILLPQANLARTTLRDLLVAAGALVDVVTAYETVQPTIDPSLLDRPYDAVTFTSSSTAQNFAALFEKPADAIGNAVVVVIGPTTADTVRDLGLPVDAIAKPHTIEGLVAALSLALERKPSA